MTATEHAVIAHECCQQGEIDRLRAKIARIEKLVRECKVSAGSRSASLAAVIACRKAILEECKP